MGLRCVSIAAALVMVISLAAPHASALDRDEGDYWLYDAEMYFEGIAVSGSFRYEMADCDTVTVGPDSYGVDVLEVSGTMHGETDDFLGVYASVDIVFHGFTYDVEGSQATVKEDTYMWANLSVGSDSVALVTMMEFQQVTTYSPPALTGFVDGETGAGEEWNEATNVTGTSTSWIDGAVEDTHSYEYQETCTCSVSSSEETVTTEAGTFSCLAMTVTGSEGDYDVYWYSSGVGSWVKVSMYSQGETEPYMSLELSEFEHSDDSVVVILVLAAIGVLLAVVVMALIFLALRRRGRAPAVIHPGTPPPPPNG